MEPNNSNHQQLSFVGHRQYEYSTDMMHASQCDSTESVCLPTDTAGQYFSIQHAQAQEQTPESNGDYLGDKHGFLPSVHIGMHPHGENEFVQFQNPYWQLQDVYSAQRYQALELHQATSGGKNKMLANSANNDGSYSTSTSAEPIAGHINEPNFQKLPQHEAPTSVRSKARNLESHCAVERRRRETLNVRFLDLNGVVPNAFIASSLRRSRTSAAPGRIQILVGAREYIMFLENQVSQLRQQRNDQQAKQLTLGNWAHHPVST